MPPPIIVMAGAKYPLVHTGFMFIMFKTENAHYVTKMSHMSFM